MTTSASRIKTSTDRFSEVYRSFEIENLKADFFGMFLVAIQARKNEQGLTQDELAHRLGKEKTGTSKLLSGPRNWQISTIAEMALALDVEIELALVDKTNPARKFTPTGEICAPAPAELKLVYSQITFANNVCQIIDVEPCLEHPVHWMSPKPVHAVNRSSVSGHFLFPHTPVVPQNPVTKHPQRKTIRSLMSHANH